MREGQGAGAAFSVRSPRYTRRPHLRRALAHHVRRDVSLLHSPVDVVRRKALHALLQLLLSATQDQPLSQVMQDQARELVPALAALLADDAPSPRGHRANSAAHDAAEQ